MCVCDRLGFWPVCRRLDPLAQSFPDHISKDRRIPITRDLLGCNPSLSTHTWFFFSQFIKHFSQFIKHFSRFNAKTNY